MESKIVNVYLHGEFNKKNQTCKYAYLVKDYEGNKINYSMKECNKDSETVELKDTLGYLMGMGDIIRYAIENDIKFVKLTSNFEGLERMLKPASKNNKLPVLEYFRDMYQDSIDKGIHIIFNELPEKDRRSKNSELSPEIKYLMKSIRKYNSNN